MVLLSGFPHDYTRLRIWQESRLPEATKSDSAVTSGVIIFEQQFQTRTDELGSPNDSPARREQTLYSNQRHRFTPRSLDEFAWRRRCALIRVRLLVGSSSRSECW